MVQRLSNKKGALFITHPFYCFVFSTNITLMLYISVALNDTYIFTPTALFAAAKAETLVIGRD